METFTGLPQLAQDFTEAQIEASVLHYVPYTLPQLRRHQDIHTRQARAAFLKNDEALLLSEQIKLDIVTDAISRQTFGSHQGGLHTFRELR